MREELNPVLAKKILGEWNRIQGTKFWEYLTARLESERQKSKDWWEDLETGTVASPLIEKWIRLQGRAHGFRDALKEPDKLVEDCENIAKGE